MAARTPGGSCSQARSTRAGEACTRGAPRGASRLSAASAGIGVLLSLGVARADDAQEFELAKTRFDAGQYEEAASRFASMLDGERPPCDRGPTDAQDKGCRLTDPDLIERARGLAAAALIALQRTGEADRYIEQILLNNPAYAPNPAVFQPEVIDRFTAVRARIRAQIEAAAKLKAEEQRAARLKAERERDEERRWVAELTRLASNERIVETHSRWIAMLPFGIGQFQNGDSGLGWFFLASQVVAGSASIAAAAVLTAYQGVDVTARIDGQFVDVVQLNSRIDTATAINRVAFGAWAALTVAGIAHAQVTFVPEQVTLRPRPVPKPPASFSAEPAISVIPGGAFAGVSIRF